MNLILQGIPGIICYVDDILVTGDTEDEHLQRLEEVLRQLHKHGIRVEKKKCHFLQDSVGYLGHRVDAEGVRPLPDKVDAIKKSPMPRNVHQLSGPFWG